MPVISSTETLQAAYILTRRAKMGMETWTTHYREVQRMYNRHKKLLQDAEK